MVLVLLLQVLGIIVLLPVSRQARRDSRFRDEARGRAEALATRGQELMGLARFGAARKAYERASRLAGLGGGHELNEHCSDARNRAGALEVVHRGSLPRAADLAVLRGLVAELEATGQAEDRDVAAALEVACMHAQNRPLAALRRARRAIDEEGSELIWLHWQLGAVLLRLGEHNEAIAQLEKLTRAAPDFGPGLYHLGLAYSAADRGEDAAKMLKKAVDLGVGPAASMDLARYYLGKERWADAVPMLEDVLKERNEHIEALRLLGSAQFKLERYDQSADSYKRAFKLQPDPRTLLSAAIASQAGGFFAEALQILDLLLAQKGAALELRFQRALVLIDLKRPAEARAEFKRFIKEAEDKPGQAQRVATAREYSSKP